MGMDLRKLIRCNNYLTGGDLFGECGLVWTKDDTKGHDLGDGLQPACETGLWVSSEYGNYGQRILSSRRFMWIKTLKALERPNLQEKK